MVEILEIPLFADKERILRAIKTKAKGCGFPGHWVLRDPVKSNELMWLRGKDLDKKHGKKVPVRRVLYYLTYKGLPLKRIEMRCGNDRCINPTHMRIRGWEDEANERIEEQIDKGYLRPEDAEKYFEWKPSPGYKPPNLSDKTDYDIMNMLEEQ